MFEYDTQSVAARVQLAQKSHNFLIIKCNEISFEDKSWRNTKPDVSTHSLDTVPNYVTKIAKNMGWMLHGNVNTV